MEIGERTNNLIYEYCLLRYRQELDLKQFKSDYKESFNNIIKDFSINSISKQSVEYHRVSYEKLINTRFSYENTDSVQDNIEIAETIYNMLILFKSQKDGNCVDYYLQNYIDSKDLIIKYYIMYFKYIDELKLFKEKQFQELRLISKQLIDDLTPIYIAKNIYKRLKADLHILKFDSTELDFVRNTYDNLKERLLNGISKINENKRI